VAYLSKAKGFIYGLAIGDALGCPVEFMDTVKGGFIKWLHSVRITNDNVFIEIRLSRL
jgi:ADP-ribosylglycohydrolase